METITHRRLGTVTVLALSLSSLPRLSLVGTIVASAGGALCSGGILSPDIDQRWKSLPLGRAMRHRRITHWWGLPVIAALIWSAVGPTLNPLTFALIFGSWIGWMSHLFGDAIFGAANPVYDLPRGVPLAPWTRHVGIGLHCGTWIEKTVSILLAVAAVGLSLLIARLVAQGSLPIL